MNPTQDIQFGVSGQSVFLDVMEGTPASVTSCEVFDVLTDDDDPEDATTGSPAIDSASTTVSATSGRGQSDPRRLNLTSTSGFTAGRSYRLAANGLVEFLDVVSVHSGYVIARTPLANTWSSGATFTATRITQALATDWVSDEDNIKRSVDPNPTWRVRWKYVVDGATYVRVGYFDLLRYRGVYSVTANDVDALHPEWSNTLPTNHQADQGTRLIKAAYESVVLDLQAVGRGDESIGNQQVVDELVRYKSVALLEAQKFLASRTDGTRAEFAAAEYQKRLDQLVRIVSNTSTRLPDGTATNLPSRPFLRR